MSAVCTWLCNTAFPNDNGIWSSICARRRRPGMLEGDKGSYVIGIDLGTTNCALAFSKRIGEMGPVELLPVPQWDGEGRLFQDVKLPSFTWILPKSLQKSGSRRLNWHAPDAPIKWVVGREAKAEILKDQSRVIHSAKS